MVEELRINMKNKKYFKIILLIELLAIYFSVLAVVSFIRAPEQYQKSTEQLLTYSDFSVSAGQNDATVSDTALVFHSKDAIDKVFSTRI